MYLISWNPDKREVEASFGGRITVAEAVVFVEEIRDIMEQAEGAYRELRLDLSKAVYFGDEFLALLMVVRDEAVERFGHVTFVIKDDEAAAELTDLRLQQVLEGQELYLAS